MKEQDVGRSVGRPSKYRDEYCQMLVDHMADGASATSFAASIDVSRSTITEWADVHPEFSAALTRGKAKRAAWWAKVARNNAVTGDGSAPITIFGLKNMGPEDWSDKSSVDHTTGGEKLSQGLDTSKLSTEALKELMAARASAESDGQ